MTAKDIVEAAQIVEGWCRTAAQLRVNQHSRILKLAALVLKSPSNVVMPEDDEFPSRIQAMKDLFQFASIVSALGDKLLRPDWIETTRRCFKDTLLESERGPSTPGRDAQFELSVAAFLQNSGLSVDRPKDSLHDWDVHHNNHTWSFECKRFINLDRLEQHARKAKSQLKHRSSGFIAIDVSAIVNPDNRQAEHVVEANHMRIRHARWLEDLSHSAGASMHPYIKQSTVAGFVWYSNMCACEAANNPSGTRWMFNEMRSIQKYKDLPSDMYNSALALQNFMASARDAFMDVRSDSARTAR